MVFIYQVWETCLEKEQVLHGLSVERLQGYSICALFINEWKWIWKLVVCKFTYNPSILSANQEGVATIWTTGNTTVPVV